MRKLIFLLLIMTEFISLTNGQQNDEPIIFTDVKSEKMLKFEEDIAYFYGANKPELIAVHYIKSLQELENGNEEQVLKHLYDAYAEVQCQTLWKFNLETAAKYELSLILAQGRRAPFEEICDIMMKLYKEIFNSNSFSVRKAAMLRTFLYQYKISALDEDNIISDSDIELMLMLAEASEKILSIVQKEQNCL